MIVEMKSSTWEELAGGMYVLGSLNLGLLVLDGWNLTWRRSFLWNSWISALSVERISLVGVGQNFSPWERIESSLGES